MQQIEIDPSWCDLQPGFHRISAKRALCLYYDLNHATSRVVHLVSNKAGSVSLIRFRRFVVGAILDASRPATLHVGSTFCATVAKDPGSPQIKRISSKGAIIHSDTLLYVTAFPEKWNLSKDQFPF